MEPKKTRAENGGHFQSCLPTSSFLPEQERNLLYFNTISSISRVNIKGIADFLGVAVLTIDNIYTACAFGLNIHCKDKIPNFEIIFPEKEYRGLSPNFDIHGYVSDLYIPTIGLPILLEEICRHMNVEIGAEAALFPEKEYIGGIFVAVFFAVAFSDLLVVSSLRSSQISHPIR
jgi:hypothetical protein